MNFTIQIILLIAVIIIALVLLIPWLRERLSQVPDDRAEIKTNRPFLFKGVEDSLATRIREAINNMGAVGPDAEDQYQKSLKLLASDSAVVVQAIGDELEVLPLSSYMDRWSLIQLLAELKDPSSLDVLDKVLSKKMPQEQYKTPPERSSLRQETINLTTAVEAITRIASTDNPDAIKLLLKHIGHESLSVRRACAQEYLERGGKNAREQLLKALPKEEHYLLDIRKVNIEEVPPIRVSTSELRVRAEKDKTDVPRVTPRRDQ